MARRTRYYEVVAVSVHLRNLGPSIGVQRSSVIDTVENELFRGCRGPWDVEDRFEAFWNRLNDSWERDWPLGKERVKVLQVTPLSLALGRLRLLGEAASDVTGPLTSGNAKSHEAPTRARRRTR